MNVAHSILGSLAAAERAAWAEYTNTMASRGHNVHFRIRERARLKWRAALAAVRAIEPNYVSPEV